MKKNRAPYFFAFMMIVMIFIMITGTCMAQSSSAVDEQEYRTKANELFAAKDYEQAAMVMEELLAKNPDLNDQVVYKQLTHIYDDYLFDFDKALTLYQTYLDHFPKGTFSKDFRDRITYLEERRSEWQALRDFRSAQSEEDNISIQQRLAKVEIILSKNEQAAIAPEMHIYLANKYFEAAEYQAASEHVQDYIAGFGKADIANTDQALALRLYADILVKQRHVSKAIRTLNQAIALASPEDRFNYAVKKSELVRHKNMMVGFIGCLIYYLAVVISLFPAKFWKYFNASHYFDRLAKPIFLLALTSLGPILILKFKQEPEVDPRFFLWLLGLSILSILVIKLLAPLSRITGRMVFVSLSGLHMAAALFMAHYLTVYSGRKILLNTAIEADRDPLSSTFRILLWSSGMASLCIYLIFSFVYSKGKGND
ncbi:hypothetical protein GZH47_14620 [Paenibacillus rhizovicinus]|uniref:Tetratricopeptide repeat protein n=1 Tax=Paenibacillus rhizovicinus TaxID=2704463 RepID=A0A6C0P0D0_9BACL|nr:hypothetical protein [Paenibacillus rhizovicinus]QHW31928.1 hypothetical protein GZH47_14620 [Paenibacillus rhizovicinus]